MINKQSNVYTIIYIIIMVIIVGSGLALTAMALKERQQDNADAYKMRQILQSVHISSDDSNIKADFTKYITSMIAVNSMGDTIPDADAFAINVANEVKKPLEERQLPVYICTIPNESTKYILPLAGMGLWGPIWGYLALDSDGNTVYGAFFDHQGETPGLGAEITKPEFCNQFNGKHIYNSDNEFIPVTVVKAGQMPQNGADYVDGISGGTITSKGVAAMLDNCLQPYHAWLETLKITDLPTQTDDTTQD